MLKKGKYNMEEYMNRRDIRETVFIMVFESLFRDDTAQEIITIAKEDEMKVNEDVEKIFIGVMENREEIDKIIADHSEKRQISRLPKVNIAILRLALYEILYCSKIPMSVAINEAVLLSKKYSHENDVIFVNGVLGTYSREHGEKV